MNAVDILERCRRAAAQMRSMEERRDRWRDSAGRMTSALDGIGSRGTGESDRMAAIVASIDAVERDMRERQREYAAEVAAGCALLDELPQLDGEIMNRYYIRRMSLQEIATDMGYSYGYIRTRKSEARKELLRIPTAKVRELLPKWYRDAEPQRTRRGR